MKILSIETSCDETAVTVLHAENSLNKPRFRVLGNALYSQVKVHEKYGGVYPMLAKREHAKNLPPLLGKALREAKLWKKGSVSISADKFKKINSLLQREIGLFEDLLNLSKEVKKPDIDAIAVTRGPGLEPALWVGITFAKALGEIWNIPVVPINHMEGHFLSVLYEGEKTKSKEITLQYPAIALLISGGHTEIVWSSKPLSYKILGRTRDDAVGEAYDKVARMLDLPYPGGPQISKLAEIGRMKKNSSTKWKFPRPMIKSQDLDFSFSGLKTAVLYSIKGKELLKPDKIQIAKEFEDAVAEVLLSKTRTAIEKFSPKSLIIAGGVIANPYLREKFSQLIKSFPKTKLLIPTRELSTDNSTMIGIAGYIRIKRNAKLLKSRKNFGALGGLSL